MCPHAHFQGNQLVPRLRGLSGALTRTPRCEPNCGGFKATPSNQLLTSPHESIEAKSVYTDLERMSVQLPLPGSHWVGENHCF